MRALLEYGIFADPASPCPKAERSVFEEAPQGGTVGSVEAFIPSPLQDNQLSELVDEGAEGEPDVVAEAERTSGQKSRRALGQSTTAVPGSSGLRGRANIDKNSEEGVAVDTLLAAVRRRDPLGDTHNMGMVLLQ